MITLDCTGMLCPQPIVELAKAVAAIEPGAELELIADDPAAQVDVAAWCRMTGNDLVGTLPRSGAGDHGGASVYRVRRSA
jgi:tRNA 2-thiouridine synthesizing protein A